MDFLIFQLYGPMASWGDIAVGEVRPSQRYPSKSAVSGLLAGALGIDRMEEEKHLKIGQHYGTAVCILQQGEALRDFHTIQIPEGGPYNSRREELLNAEKFTTLLSYRDLYMDAFYQVAVWEKESKPLFSLKKIKQALLAPKFPLYLGRKSHPLSLPVDPVIFSGISLKEAFKKYPLDKGEIGIDPLLKKQVIRYFWDNDSLKAKEAGMTPDMTLFKRDQILSRKRWQFTEREECCYTENKI